MGRLIVATNLIITKTTGGFLVDPSSAVDYDSLAYGQSFKASLTKPRCVAFHRKAFALFQVAFEAWDKPEAEYKGAPVATSFDRFRKDLTIMAGHYDLVTNFRGEVRAEAKSLSFGSMEETEFQRVYSDIINAALKHIFQNSNKEDIDKWVDSILAFS
jgi:hypothetical protein